MPDLMKLVDFENLEQYRENNRIEAKKAQGGLPHSIWETYSAFANTLGGVILLGVIEQQDKTFAAVPLPDPEALVRQFWQMVNDPRVVSENILPPGNVQIVPCEGHRVVAIYVPKAGRSQRPVYMGEDPVQGSYFRNGEGDYRCTPQQVRAMLHGSQKYRKPVKG